MRGPAIPSAAVLNDAERKRVISGVKVVHERLKERGCLPQDADYGAMLKDGSTLEQFLIRARERPETYRDVAVDAKGKAVEAPDKRLICGVTLAQIEQMLVFTHARKVFSIGKASEAKLEVLAPYIAFAWQLPLLSAYRQALTPAQIGVLRDDLLLLRDRHAVEVVSSFNAEDIRRAKALLRSFDTAGVGETFRRMLAEAPAAIGGLIFVRQDDVPRYMKLLGEPRVWRFFAREKDYLDKAAALSWSSTEALGPLLTDACIGSVMQLHRLSPARLRIFAGVLQEKFDGGAHDLVAEEGFARGPLKEFLDRVLDGVNDDEAFANVLRLKLELIAGDRARAAG